MYQHYVKNQQSNHTLIYCFDHTQQIRQIQSKRFTLFMILKRKLLNILSSLIKSYPSVVINVLTTIHMYLICLLCTYRTPITKSQSSQYYIPSYRLYICQPRSTQTITRSILRTDSSLTQEFLKIIPLIKNVREFRFNMSKVREKYQQVSNHTQKYINQFILCTTIVCRWQHTTKYHPKQHTMIYQSLQRFYFLNRTLSSRAFKPENERLLTKIFKQPYLVICCNKSDILDLVRKLFRRYFYQAQQRSFERPTTIKKKQKVFHFYPKMTKMSGRLSEKIRYQKLSRRIPSQMPKIFWFMLFKLKCDKNQNNITKCIKLVQRRTDYTIRIHYQSQQIKQIISCACYNLQTKKQYCLSTRI
eukprot:TRINITY_DN23971_c0_g1_i2.p1 TRINITY_DN23971_c0_g1~~TRINITY_DN23971_c0_g1_i2.p1  ORF type:complete len:359 (+),score=-41.16 TRINITY_DN23971_c0_g1_i2:525-1601(+)